MAASPMAMLSPLLWTVGAGLCSQHRRSITHLETDRNGVERTVVEKKGSGATVVLRAYGVLAAILDQAVKDGRLAKNPARGVDNLPRKPKKKAGRRYLTADEVRALAHACTAADKRILVLLLGFTGLRWGEAIALTVGSVDFLRKRISVTANAVQVGQKHHLETPKSHETRAVPLPAFLALELATLCEGKPRDGLLFQRPDGGHLRRPVSRTSWLEFAAERAGIVRLTPHDLRHSAASIAISAGANVLALSRMLGHASAAMTLDVYSDLFDTDLDALGIALNQVGTAPVVGKTWAGSAETAAT